MARILDFSHSTVARFSHAAPVAVVRLGDETITLRLAALDIGRASSDEQIRAAVTTALMLETGCLEDCAIERHPNGNLTVVAEAIVV